MPRPTPTTASTTADPPPCVRVRGARVHNLRGVDLDLPHDRLVVITGPSGSGKSSLAFDTLVAEGQRQYVESLSVQARQFVAQMERPDVDSLEGLPPTIAVDQRSGGQNPRSTVATVTEIYDYLRLLYARLGEVSCHRCGAAIAQQHPEEILDRLLALPEGTKGMLLAPLVRGRKGAHAETFEAIRKAGFLRARVDGELHELDRVPPLTASRLHTIEAVVDRIQVRAAARSRLAESLQLALKHGGGLVTIVYQESGPTPTWREWLFSTQHACPDCQTNYEEIEPRTFSFNSPYGACAKCGGLGRIVAEPAATERPAKKSRGAPGGGTPRGESPSLVCPECGGSRLRVEARHVRVGGRAIHEFAALSVVSAADFVAQLRFPEEDRPVAAPLTREIAARLRFLQQVGLPYLTLDRAADTLSGGESQRIRLATGIGSGLVGVCYVLDEPSIGLHQRDNERLIEAIVALRDLGNTVVVVEHDEALMRRADLLVDLGPGAGEHGGRIVARGTPVEVAADPQSSTGRYLAGRAKIDVPTVRRAIQAMRSLTLEGVTTHNLQNVTAQLPLGVFVCVTGVSGSGKSSLINATLAKALHRKLNGAQVQPGPFAGLRGVNLVGKFAEVDQRPIGRTPRSNPATYSGVWDDIRRVFAATREAKLRGFRASRFSFNVDGGRCAECRGHGERVLEMGFLPDLRTPCPACDGARFNRQTLEVRFHDRNVADVLDLRIDEAIAFFENFAAIARMLRSFQEVGLGYLKLGQSAATLSGGESQRIKLATELGRQESGDTLYLLDEPTTGLHFDDVRRLLAVLHRLVDRGNSMIVIEHNLDVIKTADWIIDLGPDGGAGGGRIVATGTPEEIAGQANNHTARYLRPLLA